MVQSISGRAELGRPRELYRQCNAGRQSICFSGRTFLRCVKTTGATDECVCTARILPPEPAPPICAILRPVCSTVRRDEEYQFE